MIDFKPVIHPLRDGSARGQARAEYSMKAGGLTHAAPARASSTWRREHRLTGNVRLATAAHAQHAFEFVREHFDKAGQHVSPIVENPSARGGCR